MQHLHILTNNHLRENFWKKHVETNSPIQFMPLEFKHVTHLIDKKVELILIDFYFSGLPAVVQLEMVRKIKTFNRYQSNFLMLFILSPIFATNSLAHEGSENRTTVAHNFTSIFLKTLGKAAKKIETKEQKCYKNI